MTVSPKSPKELVKETYLERFKKNPNMKPYNEITDKDALNFLVEENYRRDYETVRWQHPELKPYDELTEEEKQKHRDICRETQQYFNDLGKAISNNSLDKFENKYYPK